MAGYIRANSSWRTVQKGFLYANGAWRTVQKGFLYANGAWRTFFSSALVPSIAQDVIIFQSTGGTGIITLTGRNYHWSNFNSGEYSFQKYNNAFAIWQTIDTGSITNPSSGSFNTKTYQVSQSDITSNSSNSFRFVVVVTSSTNNSGTSTSNTEIIETPRDITNLSVSSSTYSPTTANYAINLTWTPSQYSGSQELQYKKSINSTWNTWTTFDGITGSGGVGGLEGGGVSYNFRIRPWTYTSANGYYGNYSNTATGNTYVAKPPNNPINLSTSNLTTNSVTFSWSAGATDSTHNAPTDYLWTYNTNGVTPNSGNLTTSTSVDITGLSSSTTYYLWVVARNSDGSSSWVNKSVTTNTPIITPGVPTNLSHTKSYSYISGTLSNFLTRITSTQKNQQWNYQTNVAYNVTWSASSNAASYEIALSTSNSNPGSVYASASGTSYTFDITQISQNTVTYFFWVRAVSSDGTRSAWTSSSTGGASTATVISGSWSLKLWRCDGSTSSSATQTNTSLSNLWTGVNSSFTHYSTISGTIAGTAASATSVGCV
jgi:hypothetical protein